MNNLMCLDKDQALINRMRVATDTSAVGYDAACNRDDSDNQLPSGTIKHSVGKSILQPFTERHHIMRGK